MHKAAEHLKRQKTIWLQDWRVFLKLQLKGFTMTLQMNIWKQLDGNLHMHTPPKYLLVLLLEFHGPHCLHCLIIKLSWALKKCTFYLIDLKIVNCLRPKLKIAVRKARYVIFEEVMMHKSALFSTDEGAVGGVKPWVAKVRLVHSIYSQPDNTDTCYCHIAVNICSLGDLGEHVKT